MIITPAVLATGQITAAEILDGEVTNAKLANSSVTINTNSLSLGGTLVLDTDDVGEGTTNLYHTSARAIAAVEAEPTLQLQEGLTVDADILIGDYDLLDTSGYDTTGLKIVKPATKQKWAGISVIEYGGTYSNNELPFGSFHNPTIGGECHGGTEASPAAVPNAKRALQINAAARYGTGANDVHTIGNIIFSTNEAQTATARGGVINLRLTPNLTTQTKDVLRLRGNGSTEMFLELDPQNFFTTTKIGTGSNDIQFTSPVTAQELTATSTVILQNLPTSDPTNAGQLWNDSGTLKISAG